MLPELLAYGEAGSGKNAFAQCLTEKYNAVELAMADPMKRFAQQVFGFTDQQLWGPSEERNKQDPRFALSTSGPVFGTEYEKVERNLQGTLVFDWANELLDRDADVGTAVMLLINKWWPAVKMQAQVLNGLSARTVLQMLGTEWGRNVNLNVWVNNARRTQRKLLSGGYRYDRAKSVLSSPGQKYDWAVVTDGRFRNEALEFKAGGASVIKIFDPQQKTLQAGVAGHASEAEQKTIPDFWFDHVIKNDKLYGIKALSRMVDGLMASLTDPTYIPMRRSWGTADFARVDVPEIV